MMLHPVVLSPRAKEDLREITFYIADRTSERTAERYAEALASFCNGLCLSPQRGTRRRDGTRSIGFRDSATVRFRVRDDYVDIITIAYRGRSTR